jgi:hypothetical protein
MLCDALPNSLIDSTTSPKVKTTEGKGVKVHSLTCNTLRAKGHATASGWGLR